MLFFADLQAVITGGGFDVKGLGLLKGRLTILNREQPILFRRNCAALQIGVSGSIHLLFATARQRKGCGTDDGDGDTFRTFGHDDPASCPYGV